MRGLSRIVAGALVSATALVSLRAAAAGDPAAWLLQASAAARQASYQGVVVYRDARTMEVLRLVHRQKDGQVQERLTSLTGQPRDMVREGDRLSCLIAGEPAHATPGLPQELLPAMSPAVLERAARHYDLRDNGESRVAGRTCRAVVMAPRDDFRYGYEVCADTATAVPLRVSLLDRQGKAVEQMLFTEVTFPTTIADSAFALPPGSRPAARGQPATASTTPMVWQLAKLPPGFEVVLRTRLPGAAGQGAVDHVLLSDGLSAVSVFGAPLEAADAPLSGLSQMGAMNVYGRAVGAFHVTVVGEVPASTVRLIGDNFSLPAGAAP